VTALTTPLLPALSRAAESLLKGARGHKTPRPAPVPLIEGPESRSTGVRGPYSTAPHYPLFNSPTNMRGTNKPPTKGRESKPHKGARAMKLVGWGRPLKRTPHPHNTPSNLTGGQLRWFSTHPPAPQFFCPKIGNWAYFLGSKIDCQKMAMVIFIFLFRVKKVINKII
jgi:hypothetical protein